MGILSGYKRFKKYLRTGEGYKLCSEWTKSDSVEMTDGSTLQESMDSIVSDVENTQNNITDVHNELMTSLGGMTFGVDAAGRYGYIKAGADTVTPFKKNDFDTINSENIKRYGWKAGPHTVYAKNPSWNFTSPNIENMARQMGITDSSIINHMRILGIEKFDPAPLPGYGGMSGFNINISPTSHIYDTISIRFLCNGGDLSTAGATAGVNATILLYIPSQK